MLSYIDLLMASIVKMLRKGNMAKKKKKKHTHTHTHTYEKSYI